MTSQFKGLVGCYLCYLGVGWVDIFVHVTNTSASSILTLLKYNKSIRDICVLCMQDTILNLDIKLINKKTLCRRWRNDIEKLKRLDTQITYKLMNSVEHGGFFYFIFSLFCFP